MEKKKGLNMHYLPLKKLYFNQEIACRFLRLPSKKELLILTIPGGPSLSGLYLDQFLMKLAEHSHVNVGIVDLPNHGDSLIAENNLPLTYQRCIEILNRTLYEIHNECENIILFGQSFGARLAFDLLAIDEIKINGAVLTGFPAEFKISHYLLKNIEALDLETGEDQEEVFFRNWKKLLTLYTYAPLSADVFDVLSSNLKTRGNEKLLDDVPEIEIIAKKIQSKLANLPIAIIQGDVDHVVPNSNLSRLKTNIPTARFYEFIKCGHFPMIEKEEETLRVFSRIISQVA